MRRETIDALGGLLRDGFNGIKGIKSIKIRESERREIYAAYGWTGGKLGDLDDGRVLGLARLALKEKPGINPEWQYDPELIKAIGEQLATLGRHLEDATGSDRVEATRRRNGKLEKVVNVISRVRFYYCSASPETDQSTELLKIGMQPRRDPRQAMPAILVPDPSKPEDAGGVPAQ